MIHYNHLIDSTNGTWINPEIDFKTCDRIVSKLLNMWDRFQVPKIREYVLTSRF